MIWSCLLLLVLGTAEAEPPIVTIEALAAGPDTTRVTIRFSVAEGHHLQANPAANQFLIPLTVSLNAEAVEFGQPEYPPGKPYRIPGTEEVLSTYKGQFVVTVPVRSDSEWSGEYSGEVRFQACNDVRCLFPETRQIRSTPRQTPEP